MRPILTIAAFLAIACLTTQSAASDYALGTCWCRAEGSIRDYRLVTAGSAKYPKAIHRMSGKQIPTKVELHDSFGDCLLRMPQSCARHCELESNVWWIFSAAEWKSRVLKSVPQNTPDVSTELNKREMRYQCDRIVDGERWQNRLTQWEALPAISTQPVPATDTDVSPPEGTLLIKLGAGAAILAGLYKAAEWLAAALLLPNPACWLLVLPPGSPPSHTALRGATTALLESAPEKSGLLCSLNDSWTYMTCRSPKDTHSPTRDFEIRAAGADVIVCPTGQGML